MTDNSKQVAIDGGTLRKLGITTDNHTKFNYYLTPEQKVVITRSTTAKKRNYQYLNRFFRVLYCDEKCPIILVYNNVYNALGISKTDDIFFAVSVDNKEIYVYGKKVIKADAIIEDGRKDDSLCKYIKRGENIRVTYSAGRNRGFCGQVEDIDDNYIYVRHNDIGKEFIMISRNAGVIISSI